jgi:hypothetical protein
VDRAIALMKSAGARLLQVGRLTDMTHARLLPLLAAMVASNLACATTSPVADAERADREVAQAQDEIRAQESELVAYSAVTTPRCDRACPVPELVCLRAARICEVASARTGAGTARAACEDATDRCDRVRSNVRARCDCAALHAQARIPAAPTPR